MEGNEYIYLQGVSSVVAGSWVTYDEDYATTLLVADAIGPVAIAMAIIDSTSEYGWFQIYGKNTIAQTDTVAADRALYIDGTAGQADDLGVAGDLIIGAYSLSASSSGVTTVFISFPSVSNDLGNEAVLTVETPTGTVDDSNTSFTVSNEPLYIVINGAQYVAGTGTFTSYAAGTITLSSAVGTGGFIRSFYNA